MDPDFNEPIHLAEGISRCKLLSEATEVKLDYKKKISVFTDDGDICSSNDSDDSDEDILATIEQSVDKSMLASPEYHSFEQLSAKMTECVCASGGVKLLILEEGKGTLVSLDEEVTYHYAAYWEGESIPFDSTLINNFGKPLRHRVGIGMLPGISIGLLSVRGPEARFLLLLEPEVAYMECITPPADKKSKTALFVVTLLDVRNTQAAARYNDLPRAVQAQFEVAMNAIKDIRAEGKYLFQRQKYKRAIKSYEHAISIVGIVETGNEEEDAAIRDIKVKIFTNLAVCYYKINKPKHVITMCENIDMNIDINTHCKGLFYYGKALEMLGKTDEAVVYLKKALKLEPKNQEIGSVLAEIDSRNIKSKENEKRMWQKVFSSENKDDIVYDVDDEFKKCILDMCQDLAGRNEYTIFDLPNGMTKSELDCIKSLTKQFDGIIVSEDGVGKKKKVSIIRKV